MAAGLGRGELLETVAEWVRQGQPRTVHYTNAHCLNLAYRDGKYRQILNRADLVYPDGMGAVWAGKFLAGCQMEKLTGADWIDDFCARAVQQGWRVFLLGGKMGVAQAAAEQMQSRHPGLVMAGISAGFFDDLDAIQIIKKINANLPHVVFVGMGAPRQEKWLAAWRSQIEAPVCWTVGALFDYLAGRERRVPAWLNRLGGEWLWRLAMDPGGKWRRYIIGNPLFMLRVLRQKLKGS